VEKAFEFFDTWLRSQKDFLDNWTGYQKELMDNWLNSIKKIQLSFSTMVGPAGGSRQLLDLFNSWFTTMINSSRAFTEGVTNLQNVWKTTMQKQTEMSGEIAKRFLDVVAKAEGTKQEKEA
jgi:hypothetical protein